MNYGVVLPIWQLTVADAESLTTRAEALGLDGVFVPEYTGTYASFSGATFSPRPVQRPNPPIWVGGAPGAVSSPAVRRCAELGDAWHPLALSLDDIEKGYATVRDLAVRHGRRERPGLAPRNLLDP